MIAYETRLGKVNISEAYLSKLIGNEVTSCFGVVGMVPSTGKQKIFNKFSKGPSFFICFNTTPLNKESTLSLI